MLQQYKKPKTTPVFEYGNDGLVDSDTHCGALIDDTLPHSEGKESEK